MVWSRSGNDQDMSCQSPVKVMAGRVRTCLDNVRSWSRIGHGQLSVGSRSCQVKVRTG